MIIGLTGKARSGKDTVADLLLAMLNPKYVKMAFADPMKDALQYGLGLTPEQLDGDLKDVEDQMYDCTPRRMMQTLGTEWGRELIHRDVWVIAMRKRVTSNTIISDVRFNNEADMVRDMGGRMIHVFRQIGRASCRERV